MREYRVRQGDQYSLSFPIILNNNIITDDFISSLNIENSGDVEITVGDLTKTYRNGEIKFNKFTFTFDFPLTQEETFELFAGTRLRSQVRIKFPKMNDDNNFIYSYNGPDVIVLESMSKESI